jgi:hypothetical protein
MITSGQQVAKALNYRKYIPMEAPATTHICTKCRHYKEIYNTFSPIKSQPYFTSDRYSAAGMGILVGGLH